MNEEEFKLELKQIAIDLFPSANVYAVQNGVGKLLSVLTRIDPAKYRELWRTLFNEDAAEREYAAIEPIPYRLEKLAIRLGDEGRYVDENICFAALEIIKKNA
jgi:hypothetical protein